nr:NADH dehydrogenase subunit 6 [Apis andreniformis]
MKMLLIYITKLLFSIIMILLLSIFVNKLHNNPMLLLIYLIFYSIFMSISLYIMDPNDSLLIFMMMIVFISGMLILFSYFVSLMNKPFKFKVKFMSLCLFFMLLICKLLSKYFINNLYSILMEGKNLNFNLSSLYSNPNFILFLLMVFMLIITLILMAKISYTDKKTLRQFKDENKKKKKKKTMKMK